MTAQPSRRTFLAAGAGAAATAAGAAAEAAPATPDGFRYCLNFATLQGYRASVTDMVDAAGKAGYHAIEPWVNTLHAYAAEGKSLEDLGKRIAGLGMTVESAIAFPQWIVDDPEKRAAGLEQCRRDMDAVVRIGGKRIAAPPSGANTAAEIPLAEVARRYRAVLELGDRMGIVAELEFWGSSTNLHQLAEAVFVAMETAHPKACVLADVFHLYKGGSGFHGLRMLSGQTIQLIHMNDYPATPPRETIADRDRVYPGDGVAPLKQILGDLRRINPSAVLSLELFNPAYWKTDPLDTARTGLAKMKRVVEAAG